MEKITNVMEVIIKFFVMVFYRVKALAMRITTPIRRAKWYVALPKFFRRMFWGTLVFIPFSYYYATSMIMSLVGIIIYGHIRARGVDKTKEDLAAAYKSFKASTKKIVDEAKEEAFK